MRDGDKIGFITQNDCPSVFDNFKKYFVNPDNPNYRKFKDSPNYPRAVGRLPGYQNPLLGDPGRGEIARWYKVKMSALENLLDQMIEQYTRDRRWYSTVRCREALWNMYRRLQWWVNQTVGAWDSEYATALSFIRDCIIQILDPGEKPRIIYQHKFREGIDDSFEYIGKWEVDDYGYLSGTYVLDTTMEELKKWSIAKVVDYPSDGLLTFNYAISGFAHSFKLRMDNEIIWEHDSTENVEDSAFTFRDITIPIPEGTHKFTWELLGEMGGTSVKIDEIIFLELFPENERTKELPKCPLPYNHHYASDYTNYFTGVPYKRPTFSTVGSSRVSDYLDMIRYVSSKENIEWKLVHSIGENEEKGSEYIFKLPLERLPETLSSKMTFNWRLKRKGYITFKYWVDGGDGSELLFYINNQLVGGPWKDTDGWQKVSFNMSQAQTYKFDFLVHKSVSKNLGLNAVYIKDIEVVEVTDYTDEPMPGDYTYGGEEAEAEYGKWLIYSHKGVLGTYYRGFPDGVEDMKREIEFEFYSECDGVFGFGHRLGTEDPDRLNIDGLVFSEQHELDESEVVWDGGLNGVEVPTIRVTPYYKGWTNKFPNGVSLIDENVLWTKDNSIIRYHISIDGDWERGEKILTGTGSIGVFCPSQHIVSEEYTPKGNIGRWEVNGAWHTTTNGVYMKALQGGQYGNAVYTVDDSDTVFLSLDINEKLASNECLNVYVGDHLVHSILSGFGDVKLNVPLLWGNDVRLEVKQAKLKDLGDGEEDKKNIVFAGTFEFDNFNEYLVSSETFFEDAGKLLRVSRFYEDGRGREVEIILDRGRFESNNSWITDGSTTIYVTLMPDDEISIKLPFNKIPYVDRDEFESLIDEIDLEDPVDVFLETFNPYSHKSKFNYNSDEWKIVDIFDYLVGYGNGDNVLLAEGKNKVQVVELDLSNTITTDEPHSLSFEYGANFLDGGMLEVLADVGDAHFTVATLTQSSLKVDGISVKGIGLPKGTKGLKFIYTG